MTDQPEEAPDVETRAIAQAANVQAGRYDAEILFSLMRREMAEFQESLDGEHEIGLRLANFGMSSQLHIRGISFENPCMIEFVGILDGNKPVKVLQHISQLNLIMIAVPPIPNEKPYRVGF